MFRFIAITIAVLVRSAVALLIMLPMLVIGAVSGVIGFVVITVAQILHLHSLSRSKE
jgi:hypothetical protein